jgi:hypothetical protein
MNDCDFGHNFFSVFNRVETADVLQIEIMDALAASPV